ncbi:unnamed protein product, partial [Iphiclides podalirius]
MDAVIKKKQISDASPRGVGCIYRVHFCCENDFERTKPHFRGSIISILDYTNGKSAATDYSTDVRITCADQCH